MDKVKSSGWVCHTEGIMTFSDFFRTLDKHLVIRQNGGKASLLLLFHGIWNASIPIAYGSGRQLIRFSNYVFNLSAMAPTTDLFVWIFRCSGSNCWYPLSDDSLKYACTLCIHGKYYAVIMIFLDRPWVLICFVVCNKNSDTPPLYFDQI